MKLFKCSKCGQTVAVIKGSACTPHCCGEAMTEMVPNTTDAATEKHVPVIAVDGCTVTVTVGSVEHPMLDAHYIEWIILETKEGIQKKDLKPGEKPQAKFAITETDEVIAAYENCNLHGYWKAEK